MDDGETILSANEVFYDAFAAGDMAAMNGLWAKEVPVSCLHPGWGLLEDRGEIIESWRGIVESPNRPSIECLHPSVRFYGNGAMVLCYEKLPTAYLLATNLFIKEGEAWRMSHHHAGGPVPPPD